MVTITKSAAAELKTIIDAEHRSNRTDRIDQMGQTDQTGQANRTNYSLRVGVAGMGDRGITYSLELDSVQRDRDTVIDLGWIKMLIDRKIAPSLQDIVIDFTDACDERGFVIKNPSLCCRCG
ncbi:MAG: iron-sulfur cluster assembly accessory protein [Methanosarcinales archaeon]|nr:iron-sulfur cluster assembly accessory protein [Methanosarcinales archaeon]